MQLAPTRGDIHLVGSIPLANTAKVFEVVKPISKYVKRYPDGETGERAKWLAWQLPMFANNPGLDSVAYEGDPRNDASPVGYRYTHQYKLKPGVTSSSLRFGSLGYADNALQSYEVFRKKKMGGSIPTSARFLMAMPAPFNVIERIGEPSARIEIEPAYEQAMREEIEHVAARVPHEELAIQWDSARDMLAFDGAVQAYFSDVKGGIAERLARIASYVPADVELGFHFCYGTFGGRHLIEPKDMGAMVDLYNRVSSKLTRPCQWLHMPVPIERDDDDYFRPLRDLRRTPVCIYLGLIHDRDGLEGTLRRVRTARKFLPEFGLSTECGWGRRDPATVLDLIKLHAEVAKAVASDAS